MDQSSASRQTSTSGSSAAHRAVPAIVRNPSMRYVPAMARTTDPLVAILAFSPVSVFEAAVPCEVFGIDRTAMGVPRYEVRLVAGDAPPLTTTLGFTFGDADGLGTLRRADTIIVPGWPRANHELPPEPVLAELRRAHRRGVRVASLCSGAFVLAAAGLL